MKLPSHLALSRHGVYYFRITYRQGQKTKERRWSLNTRNPSEAKAKALAISLAILKAKMKETYDPKRFNIDDVSSWPDPSHHSEDAVLNVFRDLKQKMGSGASADIGSKTALQRLSPKRRKPRTYPHREHLLLTKSVGQNSMENSGQTSAEFNRQSADHTGRQSSRPC